MDVVSNNYMPGDPRLIDHIVYELKAQGIFDNFRKECIADVDTKPAYQNLRQRVEGSVIGFLKTQQWRPDMNKNQVREMLRKNISESGFLETGVERIVDQVVNPKINTIFLPQVENVVYKVLGIQKPSTFDELKAQVNQKTLNTHEKLDMSGNNLLPSDLEAVSPESEPHEKKEDVSNQSQKLDNSRMDEDESPPFEPLEESTTFMVQEDNSVDSHLSGFSGLASHDSNHSFEVANKLTPMEISNQDSQFSKQSSDDHLSIVMCDDTETKIEVNEDSTLSKISKTTDSNSKGFDFMQDNQGSSDKSSQSSFKQEKKSEDKSKTDEKKTEAHRSSDKHRSRYDSKSESKDRKNDKERKLDRDKKEHRDKSKYGSKDRDKDKKDSKISKSENKSDKEHKHEKDRDRSKNSSSKHSSSKDKSGSRTKEKPKESDSKDLKAKESKTKERSESSKGRDDSKSRNESKSHSSTKNRSDSKLHIKHNGKGRTDLSDADKNASKSNRKEEKSSRKDDKHQSRSEKHSSSKKDEKRDKDRKDPKKDIKKISKDDHYSLKGRNSNRRSTDRDSSDGHSGTHSSSSSFADSSASSHLQKPTQEDPAINSRSNSGDSGNSDPTEAVITVNSFIIEEETTTQITPIQQLPRVKLIKPKFASNIFEARRLMKIRRKLGKIEKQNQMQLIKTGVALKNSINDAPAADKGEEIVSLPDEAAIESLKRRPNILKKPLPSKLKSNRPQFRGNERKAESEEENVAEVVEVSEGDDIVSIPLQNSVITKESWDAVEAKLLEDVMKTEYNSYGRLSHKEDSSVVQAPSNNEDCLGFDQEINSDFKKYVEGLQMLIRQLEDDIMIKERLLNHPLKRTSSIDVGDGINRRLPKIAIVDVTSDSEIIISPRKGAKRHLSDHSDVHNNNNKTNTRLEEDQVNEKFNHTVSKAKPSVLSKAKKAKVIDSTVNHLDTFNLPLSPAESDKSFTTTSDKKNEKDDPRVKRNSNINRATNNSCNQRYSTDDLYKPRLQFSSSRRRAAKSRDTN